MDVSFSANTWKHLEIKNIDLKLQEEFYASTPYNLNDFKQTSKPPCPIFQTIDSDLLQHNIGVKKQLIKKDNLSLAIFVTFLYEFFYQVKTEIQQKSNYPPTKTTIPSQQHIKGLNRPNDLQTEGQTDRKILSPQKSDKKTKNEEFEVLKTIKLKIYQIDLCRVKGIPIKFIKYYNNNLLKKIIFQYLTKALYNISLVEILLESNEVLCFALSLVSQSLLLNKDKNFFNFNENKGFYDEAHAFLEHFDSIDDSCIILNENSFNLLPSVLSTQSKYHGGKSKIIEGKQKQENLMNFTNFNLTKKQMKSKYFCLKEEGDDGNKNYVLMLQENKRPSQKKTSSPPKPKSPQNYQNKSNSATNQSSNKSKTSPKKQTAPSNKSIKVSSQKKIKKPNNSKSFLEYFDCLKCLFSPRPTSLTKK